MIADDINSWLDVEGARGTVRVVGGAFFLASDLGQQRSENQDRVAVLRVRPRGGTGFWCACLCDGMGGLREGGRAAALAQSHFFSALIANRREAPQSRLRAAIKEANSRVFQLVPGGGATLSGILIENDALFTINVGDSRIYHAVGKGLERLTVDDNMAEAYGAEGQGLLQYVGMKSGLEPHIRLHELAGTLIITSDGAHAVGDDLMAALLHNASDLDEFCDRLIKTANWTGGHDNASVLAISPKLAPRGEGNTSEIAVWSPAGMLKIGWIPSEVVDPIPSPENPSGQSQEGAAPAVEQPDKEHGPDTKPKPKARRKKKSEQIEIGFSEDTDGGSSDS